MQNVDTLLECRWLAPVRPAGLVLEDHAVAIARGRIVALAPIAQARSRFAARTQVVLDTHLVTPGLVNAHTHAAMTLLRGVGDDMPLQRWLQERIWPLEMALVDEHFVHDGAQLAALEMLRAGVTTCSDMYFYPEASARGLRSLGMRAVLGIIAIEMPTRYAADAEDYLRKGLAARDALRDDPLVSFTVAPHAPYTVSDATLRRVALLAEELDLPVHIHVHETAHEVDDSLATHGLRPLARLDQLGLVTERLIAVHAVHLNPAEIRLLAERGASVAHCPASNLKLASGLAPVAALMRAGVNLALGTDGAASNNRLDVLDEMRLAALLAKGTSADASVLPAMQALESATLSGARALGLEHRIGSIEVGKEADLVAFDLARPESSPVYDPVSHLVYACGRESVSDVWVAGDAVVRKRQATQTGGGAASEALLPQVAAWQNRIRACLGVSK
ncbi:MAG: TRZ/ATZ family hydrolase [Burkholderiaceae bacterium]|jgi:5-methylthioadenosine/S-adenosylhomocysteine deaminase|nr:TRZ/ATZ family hydrolase [Burkholderiaceae bacterium]